MKPHPTSTLSLKARLSLVAVIALVLGLLPSGLLLRGYAADLDFVASKQQGLPLNEGWQQVLQQLQRHRLLAAEALSTRPDARPELAAVQAAMRAALQQLGGRFDTTAADAHQQAISEFTQGFATLQAELDAGKLDVAKAMARHQALAEQAFNAIATINGDTGLALDPETTSYFAIMAGLQAAPRVKDALSELGSIARAAAVDDQAAVASALTRYREHAGQMLQQMQAARSAGGPMAQELDAMLAQAVKQRQLVDRTMQAAAQDVNYPLEELGKSFSTAAALQDELSSRVLAMLKTELARRADAAALKLKLLLVLMPSLLGLLVLLLWRATRQLLVPVAQMVSVAERIAAGDLSQPVPPGQGDELGRVLQALAHMQQRLRQLIEQIHSGAGSIRVAAHEIAAGNQNLASRTEQAAAQLQQTASGVDMLDTVVQASTQAVDQATRLAQEASGVAGSGGQVVEQVVGTMAAIHESSRRITDIISLIDGLAFQTNILALNAAVEAARAGEQGRGFAVVAAEVRSLAGRSAQAAKEIKALIQQSVERVESGTGLANDAGASMRQILGKVQAVSEVIANITAQAKVQAEQTIELGRAVRNIDAMTQQNAALVEQSAASAQSLHGQAASMDQTVQAFRL